jgi:hypothetical protein
LDRFIIINLHAVKVTYTLGIYDYFVTVYFEYEIVWFNETDRHAVIQACASSSNDENPKRLPNFSGFCIIALILSKAFGVKSSAGVATCTIATKITNMT